MFTIPVHNSSAWRRYPFKFTICVNPTYVLECPVHFISEKRNEPYNLYGEVSITGKKYAGRQEAKRAASHAREQAWLAHK